MCADEPSGVAEALGMLDRCLAYLGTADVASLPAVAQAEALRALERAEARHTAARARVLTAFAGQGGFEDDGHGSARAWLRWQTRVTHGAAAAAVAWARRLASHPVIAAALAGGELSGSWARQICDWTDRLPEAQRADADEILAGAARGGAGLAALGGLAQEMYERCVSPDDSDDGFEDRWFRLGITFRGAGRAEGDLSPGCAAALAAVLDALGKKAGPEDIRTGAQRRHDALEEACRRLIRAGMVPARAGQPTQVLVHLTLAQLRGAPGATAAEDAWAAARASQPGWLTGPEAEAALCDATVVPVVTGHVDWAALDRFTDAFLLAHGIGRHTTKHGGPGGAGRLRRALLGLATDALSGPDGLAARLRAALDGRPLTAVSLPLDVGTASETIPAHLRRAVTTRHSHCAFPGCDQPASVCDIHHIVPRSRGGPTSLPNLVPLCGFHHLTAIHRWGWKLTLHSDGTTTATSPDGARTLHSHGPPVQWPRNASSSHQEPPEATLASMTSGRSRGPASQSRTGPRSSGPRTVTPAQPNPRPMAAMSAGGNRTVSSANPSGPKWCTSAP
jgi:hypothetical protein